MMLCLMFNCGALRFISHIPVATFYRRLLLCLTLYLTHLLFLPTLGLAATQTVSTSLPLTQTNFDTYISVQPFNPSLGTLTSVSYTIQTHAQQQWRYENIGNGGNFNGTGGVSSFVAPPDGGPTVTGAAQTPTHAISLPPFDGVLDFAGQSGITWPVDFADNSQSFVSPNSAAFLGAPTFHVVANGWDTESVSGSGDWITTTEVSAFILVTYTYDPTVFHTSPPRVR